MPEQEQRLDAALTYRGRDAEIARAFREERNRLADFIRRRVRTEEDAEDILQDVFYQLAASYSVTEPIEKLTSWLFTVARNKIIDWYRKKKMGKLSMNINLVRVRCIYGVVQL